MSHMTEEEKMARRKRNRERKEKKFVHLVALEKFHKDNMKKWKVEFGRN